MSRTITLRDANQSFARLVRQVEAGEEYTITRNGTAVARLVPIPGARDLTPAQEGAWQLLSAAAGEGWNLGGEPFDRDALHQR